MRQVNRNYSVSLTEIELSVLDSLAMGLSNKEIGEKLGVTDKVIGIYVKKICIKRGYRNRVEAATERMKEIIRCKLEAMGIRDIDI